nr:hypothetical protein Iba_chr08cCG9410 [Ipomoea batatas]
MEISPLQPFEQMKSRCGHIVGPSSQHYPASCSQTGIGRQSSRQSEQCRTWRHSRQHDSLLPGRLQDSKSNLAFFELATRPVHHSEGMMRKPEGIRSASSGNISSIGAKTSSEHAPTAFSSIPLHIWKGILPKSVFVVESMSFKSNDFKHLRSRQRPHSRIRIRARFQSSSKIGVNVKVRPLRPMLPQEANQYSRRDILHGRLCTENSSEHLKRIRSSKVLGRIDGNRNIFSAITAQNRPSIIIESIDCIIEASAKVDNPNITIFPEAVLL